MTSYSSSVSRIGSVFSHPLGQNVSTCGTPVSYTHLMDDSTNQTRYLGMNLNKAPFNDPLVREAVSYAVNQQELETSVFDGLETCLLYTSSMMTTSC